MFPSVFSDVTCGTVDEVMEVQSLLVCKQSFVTLMHKFINFKEALVTPSVTEYALAQFIDCQAVCFDMVQKRFQQVGQP